MRNKIILICFGEGGHEEQARRILLRLHQGVKERKLDCLTVFGLGEQDESHKCLVEKYWAIGAVRGKYRRVSNFFLPIVSFTKSISVTISIASRHQLDLFLSTGPGLSVTPALICKAFGVRVVHVETWSRFTTRSLTGRLMYRIADEFVVQNSELLSLYPRAVYGGRL